MSYAQLCIFISSFGTKDHLPLIAHGWEDECYTQTMRHRSVKATAVFLFGVALFARSTAAQSKGSSRDQQAIQKIAQQFQDDWNRHDIKAASALFAEDVDFITVGGNWLKTRKVFEDYHIKLHEVVMKESVLTNTSTEIKFIKPDVALAFTRWSMVSDKNPDGTPRPPRQGIMTWLLEKRHGAWSVIASQNTNVRDPSPAK
jgi:uncharacterized protein (TIGR02246 family)